MERPKLKPIPRTEKPGFWTPKPTGQVVSQLGQITDQGGIRVRDVIREVPGATGKVAGGIAQSMLRSFDWAGRKIVPFMDNRQTMPETKAEQVLFGGREKRTDTLGGVAHVEFGIDTEKRPLLAPVVGAGIIGLDLFPPTSGKAKSLSQFPKEAQTLFKGIASTQKPDDIAKGLQTIFKTQELPQTIRQTIPALQKTSNPEQVAKITQQAVRQTELQETAAKGLKEIVDNPNLSVSAKSEIPTLITRAEAYGLDNRGLTKALSLVDEFGKLSPTAKANSRLMAQIGEETVQRSVRESTQAIKKQRTQIDKSLAALERTFDTAYKKGATQGTKEFKTTTKELRREIFKSLQGYPKDFASARAIANVDSPKKARALLDEIDVKKLKFQELKAFEKDLKSKGRTIGYLRKVHELEPGLITDAKNTLGIRHTKGSKAGKLKAIREMDSVERSKLIAELKTRISYKEKYSGKQFRQADKNQQYKVVRDIAEVKPTITKDTAKYLKSAGKFIDQTLGVVSTRLKNISPELWKAARRFEFRRLKQMKKSTEVVHPFASKFRALEKKAKKDPVLRGDLNELTFALYNGDKSKAVSLATKHGLQKELDTVYKLLDNTYERASKVGYELGYKENYFPRSIKDPEGFLAYLGNEIKDFSALKNALKARQTALGRELTPEEQASIMVNLIRGFPQDKIMLSRPGSFKARSIETLEPDMLKFYHNPLDSLFTYVAQAENGIEVRRFLKGHVNKFGSNEEGIGAYIVKLLAEGKIKPDQEIVVRELLTARLNERGVGNVVGAFKDVGYITTMGNPSSAITQLGDLGIAFANSPRDFLPGIWRTVTFRNKVTEADLGVYNISQEFTSKARTARVLKTTFDVVGLTAMDKFGKRALVEGALLQAFRKSKAKNIDPRFQKKLETMFGDDWNRVLKDMQEGKITDDVKFYAFNELSDRQPITMLEVPEKYLTGGNGRIFYMLKTWQIKLFDQFRRDAFQKMAEPGMANKAEGFKNLILLAGSMAIANASADELKNFIRGKQVDFKDAVFENFFKLAGFNKYSVNSIKYDGLGSVLWEEILPPTGVYDNISRDVMDLFSDPSKFEASQARTLRDIPVGGQLYYWWMGAGAERKDRRGSFWWQDGGSDTAQFTTRPGVQRSNRPPLKPVPRF